MITTEPPPFERVKPHADRFGSLGGYSTPQVCEITGLTYRMLDYWSRTNLLRASVCEAHGSGTQRRYSRDDVVILLIIKLLLGTGASLQRTRQIIPSLRSEVGDHIGPLTGYWLAVDNDGDVFLSPDIAGLVSALKGNRRPLHLLPIDIDF